MSCWIDLSGGLVDTKDDDVVRLLIGGEKEGPSGVDVEVAWPLTSGRLDLEQPESSPRAIDFEGRNAVVAPIRSVEKPPRRMDYHLRRVVFILEPRRQRRDSLDLRQLPRFRIVTKCCDSGVELVDDVGVPSLGMERRMAGSCSRPGQTQSMARCSGRPVPHRNGR